MAIVKKYQSRIKSINTRIDGVYSLEIESLDKPFKYHPGQFLHLTLDTYNPSEQWPESRCFSIQSNPGEKNIRITYAVKGKFTKKMEQRLKVGSEVWLKLPYGELFTRPHNKKNTVFIAGGTGITPFLSLFTHKTFNDYENPRIYLGFKSIEYNIYINELNLMKSGYLKISYEDEVGYIDIHQIILENGTLNDYFISGPPKMIKTMKKSLIDYGLPTSKILTDDWE